MTTSPLAANPRLLANITHQADSRHNVDQQQQQQQGKPALIKPQPMPIATGAPEQPHEGKDMGYFQRQYHTAVMSESIKAHQEYIRGNGSALPPPAVMQSAPQSVRVGAVAPHDNEQRSAPRSRRASPPSAPRALPKAMSPSAFPAAPHPDIDGYPCPCPDCNIARLQEAMHEAEIEAATQQHQHMQAPPPFHQQAPTNYYPPQHQAHAVQHQQVGMQAQQAYDFYGNPIPVTQTTMRQTVGTRQHSPYKTFVSVTVGYSPDSGYHQNGMTPMHSAGPSSPLQGAGAPGFGGYNNDTSFEVPYIPANQDFSRFAQMEEEGTPTDEDSPSRVQRNGRRGVRNLSPENVKPAVPAAPEVGTQRRRSPAMPMAGVAPEEPSARREREARGGRGARRGSGTSPDAAVMPMPGKDRDATTTRGSKSRSPHGNPRPTCPYALKIRTSAYHVRVAVSPVQYEEGTYVVLEGDRGRDVGVVVGCARTANNGGDDARQLPMVLTAASQQEIDAVAQNAKDAEAAVAPAMVAARRLRLPMTIMGAVYQHDRAKLTFMYEATERVDFRQLLRDLYSDYRCRIWLEVPAGSSPNRSPSPVQA